MRRLCRQADYADSLPFFKPACTFPQAHVQHPVCLAVETMTVTIVAVAAVRMLNVWEFSNLRWFVIPALLVAAALVPSWIGRRGFPPIGFDSEHVGDALGVVCRAFVYTLPMVFLALWLMKNLGLAIPLRPIIGRQHDWLTWLLYQFLYVAVAEEIFFRGYVQANIMKILSHDRWRPNRTNHSVAIFLSAACFALAHIVVQGRITSLATFLPGLLLAWMFIRTRSLLAPILFHGLANVTYGIMAMTLA
jgi:membrane protease YdiL (CAAX protease family)